MTTDGEHVIIELLLLLLIANNKERNTKMRSNINNIIMLSKTSVSKQQLLKTAAETHFYRKQLGLSTLQLNLP